MRLLKSQGRGRKSRKVTESNGKSRRVTASRGKRPLFSVAFRCGDFNPAAGQKGRSATPFPKALRHALASRVMRAEGPGFPGPGSSHYHPISKLSLAEESVIVKDNRSRKPRLHPLWKAAAFIRVAGVGVEPTCSTYRMGVLPLDDPAISISYTAKASKRFQREMGRVPISSSRILDPGLRIAGVTWRRHD